MSLFCMPSSVERTPARDYGIHLFIDSSMEETEMEVNRVVISVVDDDQSLRKAIKRLIQSVGLSAAEFLAGHPLYPGQDLGGRSDEKSE